MVDVCRYVCVPIGVYVQAICMGQQSTNGFCCGVMEEQNMEKMRVVKLLVVAAVVCATAGQAMAAATVYISGIDQTVPVNLVSGPVVTLDTAVAASPNPWWVVPSEGEWIVPEGYDGDTTAPVGTYTYEVTFTLDELPLSLTGVWSVDNTGIMTLNESIYGPTYQTALPEVQSYLSLHAFEFTEGFVVGENVLTIEVTNVAGPGLNPTALLLGGLSANYPPTIPAPGAVVLVSLGTCVIGFVRRRGIL